MEQMATKQNPSSASMVFAFFLGFSL